MTEVPSVTGRPGVGVSLIVFKLKTPGMLK